MDIVIPLQETFDNDELRYCLRAIEANVPHRKVWIAGHRPKWASTEIGHIQTTVPSGPKFERGMTNVEALMRDDRISEDVYFFNDDFFVMKPVKEIPYYHRGPLGETEKWKQHQMDYTIDIVRHRGFDKVIDYSLHIPMKMNRKKWVEMWDDIRKDHKEAFFVRAVYGTLNECGGTYHDDVKIQDQVTFPDPDGTYLSTEDVSFLMGVAGQEIRGKFKTPSKYEVRH